MCDRLNRSNNFYIINKFIFVLKIFFSVFDNLCVGFAVDSSASELLHSVIQCVSFDCTVQIQILPIKQKAKKKDST